ncbi:MAG: hypothetical protein E6916_08560 [Clostridium cochlearium]|uniref:hypothetical protein n=1 Tax=Clostridium cochlearium TaxID=1494 RepID=UPI00280A5304|nr:hypothetical protein [Clostridium cochlearium]MDU1443552.1 hypothetical protein [Clostridium cochlearium]
MNFKCDYLIALVGTNPTPVFLNAMELTKNDSNIYLVYTEEKVEDRKRIIGTKHIAKFIGEKLIEKKGNLNIKYCKCDKSNPKQIKKCANKIINEMEYENKIINLDYTGSTKMMCAIFYDILKQNEKIHTIYSYVDVKDKSIKFEVPFHVQNFTSKYLDEVIEENNITISDLLNIHGYNIEYCKNNKEKNEFQIIENIKIDNIYEGKNKLLNNTIKFNKIYMRNGNIACILKSTQAEKNVCKMEIFKAKNSAYKIGGNESFLCYICNAKEEDINGLKKELNNISNNMDLSKRIIIMNENEENIQEKIKEFIERM